MINTLCALDATAGQQYGLITRQQALAAGMTDRMVQWRTGQGLWVTVHPGVYRMAGAPATWHQRVLAAALAARAVASHRTAARLWGLDGDWGDSLEVTATTSRTVHGVVVHHSRHPPARVRRQAVPCTTATRTLIDLATILVPDRLEEALDSALREHLTSVEHVKRHLRAGRRGAGVLRHLVESRTGERPHESVKEAELSRLLVAAGLPRPVRQYELRRDGRVVARFDLAWPDVRIAVEYMSYRHHFGRRAWRADAGRSNAALADDWLVFAGSPEAVELIARAFSLRRAA